MPKTVAACRGNPTTAETGSQFVFTADAGRVQYITRSSRLQSRGCAPYRAVPSPYARDASGSSGNRSLRLAVHSTRRLRECDRRRAHCHCLAVRLPAPRRRPIAITRVLEALLWNPPGRLSAITVKGPEAS